VVASDGAEEIMGLDGVGDQRRRGPRRDGDYALLLVHIHCGYGGARTCVCNGKLGAGIDDPIGGRYGLLGFATIVDEQGFELFALYAARLVDRFDGGQGASLDLVTVLG